MNAEKVRLRTKALRLNQRPSSLSHARGSADFESMHDFFVLSLPSAELLKIAKFLGRHESSRGVQRQHKEDRDKEIGKFIRSDHPFFPNTIIVNLPLDFQDSFYDESTMLLDVLVDEGTAYVIDGQHRLKAFASEHSGGVELPLVVAAYFGLELPTIAEIFTRINFFQVPVSKSVVYDLLQFNTDPEFAKFRDAHKICEKLNSTIGSPFYNMIKMLGIGTGLLSQAAFVEAISTRYKIIQLLGDMPIASVVQVLSDYFAAIAKAFPSQWNDRQSILSRTVGFNALVKVLMLLLQHNSPGGSRQIDFVACATSLATVDVDSEDIRSFGGFKGVNTLADRFREALTQEGLL